MNADFFIDTNVLVYWRDASDPAKQAKAAKWMRWLLDNDRGMLSSQVLQEYYVTVTRKLTPGMPKQTAREDVADLADWNVIWPSHSLIERSWELEDQYALSYWDSLILAAASIAACKWVLSDDMQAGLRVGSLQIINPFEREPKDID